MADLADDDPYVRAGRAVTSGAARDETPAKADDDPYVQAGRAATATLRTDSSPSDKAPDATGQGWSGIPFVDNLSSGLTQGARDVVSSGLELGRAVDRRVPILRWLDEHNPLLGDPEKAADRFQEARRAFEASEAGKSYTGEAGRIVGGLVMTLPLMGPIGAATGAGTEAAAAAAARFAPTVGRVISGVGDLVSGTAAAPEAGVLPNLLARGTSRALQGGVTGAEYGALTSGGTDQSVGSNILDMAKLGMVAGPTLGAVGDAVGGAARGVGSAYRSVTGRAATQEVDATIADAEARAAAQTPPPAAPQTGSGGAPQSGGAAAVSPADLKANAPTASQAEAQRLRAFDLKMNEQSKPGADFTEYVKDSRPTLAEGLADPHLAGVQRNVLPGEQRYANLIRANNEARQDHLANLRGDPVTLENLEAARSAQAETDLQSAWAGAKDTTAEPVLAHIKDTMAGPEGKLKPVSGALQEVADALHDSAGKLETDPRQLYGARRQITYMLSKTGRTANPAYGDEDVQRALIATREVLDKQILAGAPNFQTFLDNFRAASPEIDKQAYLQRFDVKGADGNIQLSRVNTMLKTIRSKLAAPGANPAKNLDEDTMDGLFRLRADLLRENNRTLVQPAGSPTAYNQGLGAELGINAAHAVASHLPVVGRAVDPMINRLNARNVARAKEGYIRNLLEPRPMTPPP